MGSREEINYKSNLKIPHYIGRERNIEISQRSQSQRDLALAQHIISALNSVLLYGLKYSTKIITIFKKSFLIYLNGRILFFLKDFK